MSVVASCDVSLLHIGYACYQFQTSTAKLKSNKLPYYQANLLLHIKYAVQQWAQAQSKDLGLHKLLTLILDLRFEKSNFSLKYKYHGY